MSNNHKDEGIDFVEQRILQNSKEKVAPPFSSENSELPQSNEAIRQKLMDEFISTTQKLQIAIDKNRTGEGYDGKGRLSVIVSLWEEDDTMITTKMFKRSLDSLVAQAKASGLYLDVIMVANTTGGKTPELGQALQKNVTEHIRKSYGTESMNKVTAQKPEHPSATEPWDIELNMQSFAPAQDGNRYIFVDQPACVIDGKDVNAGKLRALRDVSHALANEIIINGYAPDAIFQMDAETILEYAPDVLSGNPEPVPPLKILFNNLKRRNLIAVGTKDRFEPINPEIGEPLNIPRPSAQEGYMLENKDRFITLPGGALMAQPEYYLGGMMAISNIVPGCGVEDYMLTKMIKEFGKQNETIQGADSLNIVTHLNRCPSGREAIGQMKRWRDAGRAVDEIFPDDPYKSESLLTYLQWVLKSRIQKAAQGDIRYMRQVIDDLFQLGDVTQFLSSKDISDIFHGSAAWKHNNEV